MSAGRGLAHFGIRARQLEAMIVWYRRVLGAHVQYRNETAAFLTFDDEHHRIVLWTDAATVARNADAAGVDHLCIDVTSFEALAATYVRLREDGVLPVLAVNHRFTTSLYYRDPDGNEIELSVDNFETKDEGNAFVRSDRMAALLEYPFGDLFDPEELVQLVCDGAERSVLARLGMAAASR